MLKPPGFLRGTTKRFGRPESHLISFIEDH